MVSLYQDPKGEGIFGAMSSSNGAKMAVLSCPDDVEELKKKIICLESTIKKLRVSMLGNMDNIKSNNLFLVER